jgi:hypothetical protein
MFKNCLSLISASRRAENVLGRRCCGLGGTLRSGYGMPINQMAAQKRVGMAIETEYRKSTAAFSPFELATTHTLERAQRRIGRNFKQIAAYGVVDNTVDEVTLVFLRELACKYEPTIRVLKLLAT